jgi:uncharacterized protein with NRDE domain
MHPDYRLILAANRDEFYDRPTAPLDYWVDNPDVLAGRDLKCNGTWLGVTKTGRIAAATNFREPQPHLAKAPSRGSLVSDYLMGRTAAQVYLKQVKKIGLRYNGFNLIAGDLSGLYYCANRAKRIQKLTAGLYGISNHLLDTPWPKIRKGKAALQDQLNGRQKIDIEKIFNILADRSLAPDNELPQTGVSPEWERILSPLFITSDVYGTRCSSIVLMEKSGRIMLIERTFLKAGDKIKVGETRKFRFTMNN